MRILMLGGTPSRRGGVEEFIDRARHALASVDSVRVDHIATHTASLLAANGKQLAELLRAVRQIRRARYDCIWLQYGNFFDLIFIVYAKLLGSRVIVTPHLGSAWRSQKIAVIRWLSANLLAKADGVLLLAKSQAAELNMPSRVPKFLGKTFLPRPQFNWSPPAASPSVRIVHAGRLSEDKGTFEFIEVCRILRDAGVEFCARIIGKADSQVTDKICYLIDSYGLQQRVQLCGAMANDDLQRELANSDFLIHLSVSDSYPLIVLEAIQSGVFPICRELPGAKSMVEEYWGAVARGGTLEIRHKVVDLVRKGAPNGILREVVQRKINADFDWVRCAEHVISAARRIIERDRASPNSRLN